MVAFEVAAAFEKAERTEEAQQWYKTAHERFRRAEWKKKAVEALARLGVSMPAEAPETPEAGSSPAVSRHLETPFTAILSQEPPMATPAGWLARDWREQPGTEETAVPGDVKTADPVEVPSPSRMNAAPSTGPAPSGRKRRTRGRRGGHGRQKKGPPERNASAAPVRAASPPSAARSTIPENKFVMEAEEAEVVPPIVERPEAERTFLPRSGPPARPRLADPGVSSRLVHLEALLRRLIAATPHPLTKAEEAPVGPGVFVLSDADLVSCYYVESCRTLRIAIGNLLKGRTSRSSRDKGDSALRANLAEHLGISEAKVSQYLKQHCVIRWLQMDDEAIHLAHLAMAVLRPPLNAE